MTPAAQRWLRERTSRYRPDDAEVLCRRLARSGHSISVVVPARDEEARVGAVVGALQPLRRCGAVDEVVVIDGQSGDRTAQVAAAAGARVVPLHALLEVEPHPGKGGALWGSLLETTGDLLVFLDADVAPFDAAWVAALVAPLLADEQVQLVKGAYERPGGNLLDAGQAPAAGGRVTELMARPLLNLLWPDLAGFVQPLAGECAARRDLLERLPFASGYGVEIGLLVDAYRLVGLSGLAQVDLGERLHRRHSDAVVARMSAEVLHAALRRVEPPPALAGTLDQPLRGADDALRFVPHPVGGEDFPALASSQVTRRYRRA